MNRFIVVLNNGSPAQKNAITALYQSKDWGFWHHIEDVWLLSGVPAGITARAISEELSSMPLIGKHVKLVIQIPSGPAPYWGNGSEKSWEWMKATWGPPGT